MAEAVDVDDRSTWPAELAEDVAGWAERLRGSTEHTSDLEVPWELEDRFHDLLGSRPLRVYHCTRLLDSEVARIRSEGLRRLDAELVASRIEAAYQEGALDRAERDALLDNNVFALRKARNHQSRLCSGGADTIRRRPLRGSPAAHHLGWGGHLLGPLA